MRVATILPTPLLGMCPDQEYNMCLYHIVKSNPEYAKFFRETKAKGNFVIMDNGAAEGVNPSWDELIDVYGLVEPSEIVLPDVVWNKEETLRRTKEAYQAFVLKDLHKKYQFMAVPQGENFTEWLECMKIMIKQNHVTTIGVSKFVTPKYQEEMGTDANVRLECCEMILSEAARIGRPIQIHLLGCWSNPAEIGKIAKTFGTQVRGTDSAIAYVYTRNNVEYSPEIERPDQHEIDFHNGTVENVDLLYRNIKEWADKCNGR